MALNNLTIFNFSDDVVLQALENNDVFSLCRNLYKANGGNLSTYIRDLVLGDENVYVDYVAQGKEVPLVIKEAAAKDLKMLQMLAQEQISFHDDEPEYIIEKVDLAGDFQEMIANIQTRGFGIWAANIMFEFANDKIVPVRHPDSVRLSDLVDYERERTIVLNNTKAFLDGKPAQNMLLTGDAGTGKSSTIKAVVNELAPSGLRIIEIKKHQIKHIPDIIETIEKNPLKFIIFIDDISFATDDDHFGEMKALIEGSLSTRSENSVIYATSNRRHIVKEKFSDRDGDEIHVNDSIQEMVSLSERFGIHVTFSKPNKKTYLNIVHSLAEHAGIEVDDIEAERFATYRGGRSGRTARQFIESKLAE